MIGSTSIVRGWNFIISQTQFRKLQKSAVFKRDIEGDALNGKCFNYIFGLLFLETDEVEDSFVLDSIVDMSFNDKI